MNKAQTLKEIRHAAKTAGLTFKVKRSATLNGGSLYQLVNRATGAVLVDNYRFSSAFDDSCSGYFDTLAAG